MQRKWSVIVPVPPEVAISYIPSITIWTRIEPKPRDAALTRTLQAQVRDPLWMLSRQWQVGEFMGEDAGSPVQATLDVSNRSSTTYRPGTDPSATIALDPESRDASSKEK